MNKTPKNKTFVWLTNSLETLIIFNKADVKLMHNRSLYNILRHSPYFTQTYKSVYIHSALRLFYYSPSHINVFALIHKEFDTEFAKLISRISSDENYL